MNQPDARTWAWIRAWDNIEAAMELQQKFPDAGDRLTVQLDRTYRQADLFARLALAPRTVGEEAAGILRLRKEQEKQNRRMMEDFLAEHDDQPDSVNTGD